MSYDKAMKHFKNHHKDRFYQQCGGPVRELSSPLSAPESKSLEVISLRRIAERATEYPIYIVSGSGGIYSCVDERNSFATKIESREALETYIRDYV